ncbi:hypothetical protein [Dictyobacter kobayashii]|uniref:Uncharacterized protein n=1 Tax=Dictyobacter kobayashii TaxID=2014872 RepID=A0A402AQH9_9CHLR|nr:hypothetical protein [Dictyobacter kobayashii]GCE21289.1 hypothetical protein KDK_50890 [Dictyobacter kobayashii]
MGDPITQMRLTIRLERYLSDYAKKKVQKDAPYREEWDRAWHVAEMARANNDLTPVVLDDVRLALNKL